MESPENLIMEGKNSPTVIPIEPFDPDKDAKTLHTALGGLKVNKKPIIQVVSHRTNFQRLEIAKAYAKLYGKDLVNVFKKKLHKDFEDLVVSLMTPTLPDFYVKELHYAMDRIGTIEEILIEVLCTLSNKEILLVKSKYLEEYGKALESDLKEDTSGVFTRLMVSLCRAARDESNITDPLAAECTAQKLYETGPRRPGTDESVFIRVFCYRNFAQLRLIFKCYETISGQSIKETVKDEFSGDAKQVLLTIIKLVKNPSRYFAKILYKSMKGLGTNDRQLIRLVVTRCEIDMADIKKEYLLKYGRSLADDIKDDCSGSYRKCLLSLIGEEFGK